jgi:hypothetical protein
MLRQMPGFAQMLDQRRNRTDQAFTAASKKTWVDRLAASHVIFLLGIIMFVSHGTLNEAI